MHLVHTRINAAASLGLTVYLTASEVNKLYPVIGSAPVSNRRNLTFAPQLYDIETKQAQPIYCILWMDELWIWGWYHYKPLRSLLCCNLEYSGVLTVNVIMGLCGLQKQYLNNSRGAHEDQYLHPKNSWLKFLNNDIFFFLNVLLW